MVYSEAEVARMVGQYESLRSVADTDRRRLNLLLILADLTSALDKLDQRSWEVMLLCGLLGLPQAEVARLLHTSQRSISRRWQDALEDVHYYINGGQ